MQLSPDDINRLVGAFRAEPSQRNLDLIARAATLADGSLVTANLVLSVVSVVHRLRPPQLDLTPLHAAIQTTLGVVRFADAVCRISALGLLFEDAQVLAMCVARIEAGGFTRHADEVL